MRRISDFNGDRLSAELGFYEFMKEYSNGKSTVYLYDGVRKGTGRYVGMVINAFGDFELALFPGNEEEDFFLQYGGNDEIPASVLPKSVRAYIKALMD